MLDHDGWCSVMMEAIVDSWVIRMMIDAERWLCQMIMMVLVDGWCWTTSMMDDGGWWITMDHIWWWCMMTDKDSWWTLIWLFNHWKTKKREKITNFEELNWTLMDDGYCGRAIIESFYRRVRQSRERNDDASCGGFMDDVDDDGCWKMMKDDRENVSWW